MSQFPIQTPASAPEAAQPILEKAKKANGFVPNLYGVMANAPALLEAYTSVAAALAKGSLSATEQQVVLIAASELNGCTYCVAAHSVIAKMSKVPADVVESLRNDQPLADAKLEALRQLAKAIVESRGWPSEDVVSAFYAAGYGQQQYLEVVLGIGLKTLSNYTNHATATPLDAAFQPAAWEKAA